MTSKVTVDEVNAFFEEAFPSAGAEVGQKVVEVGAGYAKLVRFGNALGTRPGGYISGPTQMAIADAAAYVAVFTMIGIVPMAVTSNLTMNFMRPCIGEAVEAEGRILKLGKTLAVIEVDIRAQGSEKPAAHAVLNYSLPQG